jgi:hypothetical protein
MNRIIAAALLAFAAVSFSGCVTRIADFTALSTKNVTVPGDRGPRVQGEDLVTIVLFFPTGQSSIKQAVDNAIQKGGGDALVDGVIYNKCWYIPLLIGQCGFVVEGTPVKVNGTLSQNASGDAAPPAPLMGAKK